MDKAYAIDRNANANEKVDDEEEELDGLVPAAVNHLLRYVGAQMAQ